MDTQALEQEILDSIKTDPVSFEQQELNFAMPKLAFLDKRILITGIGSALGGTAGGTIGAFLPASLQAISGLPQLVVGTIGKFVLKGKDSTVSYLIDGVLISGIANIAQGLIARGGFSQEIQKMFQQKEVETKPKEEQTIGVENVRW